MYNTVTPKQSEKTPFDNFKFLALSLILLFFISGRSLAAKPKVVVLVASGVSFSDVLQSNHDNLARFLNESSAGILTIRVGRVLNRHNRKDSNDNIATYVTLGAGLPAVANSSAAVASNADSKMTVYDCSKGTIVPLREQSVIAQKYMQVVKYNENGSYQALPGVLGDALHEHDFRTAAVGNFDIPNKMHREVVYIAADKMGIVDYGDVESEKLQTPSQFHAYGKKANVDYIAEQVRKSLEMASLVVVESADTGRADAFAPYCTKDQLPVIKNAAIASLDCLLGKITSVLSENDYLVLISPYAPSFPLLNYSQTGWIVIKGAGFESGLLTSPSTRLPGLVTLTDFAPTVLSILKVPVSNEMRGRAIVSIQSPHKNNGEYLNAFNKQITLESKRNVLMRVFSLILAAVVSVLTLILLRYSGRISRETITWASSIVVCIIFALLVSPLVFNLGVFGTATVIVLIFTSLFLFGILLLKNPNFFVLLCCGFTALVIAVDLLLGSHLLRASPVGYSLAEGARFYGIGNEAMGIMLGAVFYFLSCALPIGSERKIQIMFSVLVLLSTFILIGSPAIGSNVGGALATVPAAVVFIVMVSGKRLSAKWIIPALAITMVAMLGTFAFDYLREAKEQSHAARLLELLYSGGASEVLQIIVRKLQVNLRLILTSLWSKLFAIAVVSTALLACHIKKLGQTLFNTRQEKAGVVGLIVAAVGALIFNDSGVVSAGMCSLYLWTFFALRVVPPDKYSLRDS